MPSIRILLADDHTLFREGLARILASQPDLEIVGEASDGVEALVKARELKPDLILMDILMPGSDGLEATKLITRELPEIRIIILTVRDEPGKLFEAIKNGAQGYLLKNMGSKEIVRLIRGAVQGDAAITAALAGKMLEEFRRLSHAEPIEDDELVDLTRRELEVLGMAATGATDKEIASDLTISVHTVKSHMRSILSKLHSGSRREAARLARHKGLV